MSRYKIKVLTLQEKTLHFTVGEYTITEGNFIQFIDERTGRNLKFHASRCEIEEVSDEKN